MANFYATAKSNFFKVRDREEFLSWVKELDLDCQACNDNSNSYMISADNCGWPDYNHETNEDIDFCVELGRHLPDDEVAVLMQIGSEKMRYISGYSIAVTNEGSCSVDLDDIYAKASKAFNRSISGIDQ